MALAVRGCIEWADDPPHSIDSTSYSGSGGSSRPPPPIRLDDPPLPPKGAAIDRMRRPVLKACRPPNRQSDVAVASCGFSCAAKPANLTSCFELLVTGGPDLLRPAGQKVGRRDVADRAVQPHIHVVTDEPADYGPSLLDGLSLTGTDAVALDRPVPALDLPIRLRSEE